ncbi:MAG: GyrI-like domain-containing protein [Legionella sp.]|nr:GyrI-like domain-containing protein [Legionella sp.]
MNQLSNIAFFSKYHFHRLFTVYTGLSLQQYIRCLRLKRAAHQLVVDDKTIIEIAINAGFESHESFTRAFKQTCGINPSKFRVHANWTTWEKPPYRLPKEENIMNVEIQNIVGRRLAVVEHRGPVDTLASSLNKLISWANAQTINLKLKAGESFGFAYDDPATTEPAIFRFDLGITVPEQVKLEGDIIEKHLPAGRYAVAIHKGSRDKIGDTVYSLYQFHSR